MIESKLENKIIKPRTCWGEEEWTAKGRVGERLPDTISLIWSCERERLCHPLYDLSWHDTAQGGWDTTGHFYVSVEYHKCTNPRNILTKNMSQKHRGVCTMKGWVPQLHGCHVTFIYHLSLSIMRFIIVTGWSGFVCWLCQGDVVSQETLDRVRI